MDHRTLASGHLSLSKSLEYRVEVEGGYVFLFRFAFMQIRYQREPLTGPRGITLPLSFITPLATIPEGSTDRQESARTICWRGIKQSLEGESALVWAQIWEKLFRCLGLIPCSLGGPGTPVHPPDWVPSVGIISVHCYAQLGITDSGIQEKQRAMLLRCLRRS